MTNQYGHEVKQIRPQYVNPFRMGNKNDKNDAIAIVEANRRPGMRDVPEKVLSSRIDNADTGFVDVYYLQDA